MCSYCINVVVIIPALHTEGPGFKPQRSHIINGASCGSLCGLQRGKGSSDYFTWQRRNDFGQDKCQLKCS